MWARSSARSTKPITMSFDQIGIWRSTSGTREAGCSSFSVSRTRLSALSILLRNRKRGIFSSSSSRRISCSCGIFFSSASHTTTAASTAGSAARMSCDELDRAGAIDEGVAVAEEGRGRDRELDAHLVMARLGRGVADRRARLDRALARDRAGARQDAFEKRGLAALEWAHQCDAPWTPWTRASVACHVRLPPGRFRFLPRAAVC